MFKKRKKLKSLDTEEILADSISALAGSENAEGSIEKPFTRIPFIIALCIIASTFAYMLAKAAILQVEAGDDLLRKSQDNRFVVESIEPPRGKILDRYGKTLAFSTPSFGIIFDKKEFLSKNGDIRQLLSKLGELLTKDKNFFYELGLKETGIENIPNKIIISRGLTPIQFLSIAPKLSSLPGIKIRQVYKRIYTHPYATSHITGFVGAVSKEDLDNNPQLAAETTIGKIGIEKKYDSLLRGKRGKKIVEVYSSGKKTTYSRVYKPQKGKDLILTIDGEFQQQIYSILESYTNHKKAASVVALDPQNGEVIALVSFPGYDTNLMSSSISKEQFQALLKDPLKPMFNRVIAGRFPSASTIKPVIAIAALEEKIIDPYKKIYDKGYIEIPDPYNPGRYTRFVDWRPQGMINLTDAIAYSANVYFYIIGGGYKEQKGLGIWKIKEYANKFGLGKISGIDLIGEESGIIPDPELKKKLEPNNPKWRIGDTYNTSIGQGGVLVTPLQIANMTAAIANGGILYRPHILKSISESTSSPVTSVSDYIIRSSLASKESIEFVRKAMRATVTYGTAGLLKDLALPVGAKTGTAQVGSSKLPHAWVTTFVPVDKPVLVLTVMVEHAGGGATITTPIAHEILNWYIQNRILAAKSRSPNTR